MTTPDLIASIEADSTQINADELAQPITVTVTGVTKGTAEQPVNILLAEFPERAYRPCKSMRRVLVAAWGSDASAYIGRRITLFNDPTVRWGGAAVGGVRIAALSHIDKPLTIALTVTRGRRAPFVIQPLPDVPAEITGFTTRITDAATVDELALIAADIKAHKNLGEYRAQLLKAWAERKAALTTTPGPGDVGAAWVDTDDALDAAQDAEADE
jgi:hypothetical protein